MVGDILTLKKPIAPCLIRVLYAIALILIVLGLLRGIAAGAWIIGHQPPAPPAIAADASTGAPAAAQPAQAPRPQFMRRGRPRMMMGPAFMRQGPAAGIFRIIFSLIMSAILLMIVRVLAEIGIAILAMPREQRTPS